MPYLKYLIFAGVASMLLFPKIFFSVLIGIVLIVAIVLLVLETVFYIYIIVKVIIEDIKKRIDNKIHKQ